MRAQPDDSALGERLAARLLELIDIPSESRSEGPLAAHVGDVLRAGGVPLEDLGDDCLLARPQDGAARVVLAGHLDTVPAQDNLPGRIDAERVHGLGASDMKGALTVMIELGLAGAPYSLLFFPREELPIADSALTPLLQRARHAVAHELAVVMEPTDNEIHAGCLGNINATWTFRGRSGHSARPWQAENAIERAAAGVLAIAAHAPVPFDFGGLEFKEVASVTTIGGGIAANVIPDRADCHVNFRYAPGRTPAEAENRLREMCAGHGELHIDSNAPSGAVCADAPLAQALREAGELAVAPKQAWTPVAELTAAGIAAVNYGPGETAQAHRRDESLAIASLVRSYRVLEAFSVALA